MFIYPLAITITTEKKTSYYMAYCEDSTGKLKNIRFGNVWYC